MSPQERFSVLLSRCSQQLRTQVDERLRPWGMTLASWRILRALALSGERFHQARLAKEVGVETPTLVSLLDRMEKMEWVRREPDPGDRRAKIVEVTPAGAKLFRQLQKQVKAVREDMFGGLSEQELDQACGLLEKVLAKPGA